MNIKHKIVAYLFVVLLVVVAYLFQNYARDKTDALLDLKPKELSSFKDTHFIMFISTQKKRSFMLDGLKLHKGLLLQIVFDPKTHMAYANGALKFENVIAFLDHKFPHLCKHIRGFTGVINTDENVATLTVNIQSTSDNGSSYIKLIEDDRKYKIKISQTAHHAQYSSSKTDQSYQLYECLADKNSTFIEGLKELISPLIKHQ